MTSPRPISRSLMCTLVFWGVLFLLVLQVERLFLLPETAALESPTASLLIKVFLTGLAADFVAATGGIGLAAVLATLLSIPVALIAQHNRIARGFAAYRRGILVSLALIAILLLVVLMVDVGYYGFSQQHVNFVFFEYLDDLLHTSGNETGASQAAEQTIAELDEGEKWGVRIGSFLILEGVVIAGWWLAFRRKIGPMLAGWETQRPVVTSAMLVATVASGAAGLGPFDVSWLHHMAIDSEAYFNLAQNPVFFAQEPLRDAFFSQWSWAPRHTPGAMELEEAVQVAQEAVGRGASFPFPRYPLVREINERATVPFAKPINVVLIFVEGLDRRYLGQTIEISGRHADRVFNSFVSADSKQSLTPVTPSGQFIRLTPFLDSLMDESLYFTNFFSNGVATTRGLLSALCSYYPRQGTAAIKTRYEQDYLCLPSLLRKGGFNTEMVISLDSDIPGIRPFMARNGLNRLYGESDFPESAERLGVGLTDGALFGFMRRRVEALQNRGEPFFLAALTSSMHHPFTIPLRHPEVQALQQHRDGYVAALRYFDLEFETFFTSLRRDGLLRNSMVIILGDHGRHEPVGTTDVERQVGRFLVPLFIWLDDSARTPDRYRPHHVERIASQVDLAPTILAMNGLMPRVVPFMGRDLACLFARDCLYDNFAYLSNVYDDLIGLVDQDGLWLYSFRRGLFYQTDLKLKSQAQPITVTATTDVDPHYRRLLALYLTANMLLEKKQIWSWKDLDGEL